MPYRMQCCMPCNMPIHMPCCMRCPQAELTRKRLERAGKLTSGLASEGVRWAETADMLQKQTLLLVGGPPAVAAVAAAVAVSRAATAAAGLGCCRESPAQRSMVCACAPCCTA